ncbi:transporter substrate-binding domain-containing protein [Legionella fallonii]|uniref:Putative Bacterial extracellular solute-binding family protein n=1 Tax=Legionella fallonii LLAP-10 TaxID=1212491 RepID=A0A098G158_9GAMM|nr:transporter substrate-binding domain-containing protein [Legionella fallonii]CEG55719.1 putative Bacterial extracellular solute-binding family protein [Legionella fallonii LLAP-10]
MKQIKTLLFACSFFFSISGYSNIKIGTLHYDPPFIISPSQGFDIDLIHLLCTRLQQHCQLLYMDGEQLYQALQDGTVDLAIGGISISPLRKTNYIFSLPYLLSKGQFLTLKRSKIHSLDDLKGTTVGVIHDDLSGGIYHKYLVDHYQGQFQINEYNTVENMFAALNNNNIAAVFLYRSDTNYWNHNGGDLFKTVGPVVRIGEGIAIMALPRQEELIQRINKLLQQIEADNSYMNLYKTYFYNN